MSKSLTKVLLFLFCVAIFASCNEHNSQNRNIEYTQIGSNSRRKSGPTRDIDNSIPINAQKIISSYPDFKLKYINNHLVFTDGRKIIYDDKKTKSFATRLNECDIEDMFFVRYDSISTQPKYLNDCGRGRNEELFAIMYGNDESTVCQNLVKVDWFGQTIRFTKINGAAKQLAKVASELKNMPKCRKYLTNASTFYWRKVRGANRMSAHSYGIAIDINTKYSNYWLWSNPKSTETAKITYQNQIPLEIVRVFEKNGFIWGGRWYHYDTMHFEYRPELL